MLIDRSGVSDASRVTAEGHVAPEQARAGRIGDRVTQGKCTLVESQWCGAVYRVGRCDPECAGQKGGLGTVGGVVLGWCKGHYRYGAAAEWHASCLQM